MNKTALLIRKDKHITQQSIYLNSFYNLSKSIRNLKPAVPSVSNFVDNRNAFLVDSQSDILETN